MGLWSLIVPQESYNKVLNPSAEIAGNFSAIGASCTVTRSASLAYRGVYSYKIDTDVAANSGIDLVTTVSSNTIHFVSFRVTSLGGVANLRVSLDNNAHYNTAALLFTDGTVLHYGVQIPAAEANGSTSLHIMQEAGAVKTFYIDAVQYEEGTTWTTYIDGDEPGCHWEGLPHGSRSGRPENERSGGYVKELVATYSAYVESVTGLGGPTKELLLEPRALIDGNVVQGQRSAMRAIGLTVSIKGTSLTNFYSLKKAFMSAISRHLVVPQQPVTFWYSGAGKIVTTRAIVESGDEGGLMDGFYEKIPLSLLAADDVFWEELIEQSAVVNNTTTLAVEQMVAYRPSQPWSATTGFWDALGAPELDADTGNTWINGISKDIHGNLFVCGIFLNLGGIANADYAAYRTPGGTWTALAAGLNTQVFSVIPAADGLTYYLVGKFTNVGDANGDYCIKWTVAGGFASLGAGPGGSLDSGALGRDGTLYVGLHNAATGAQTIRKWTGAAWADFAVATSSGNQSAFCITVAPDGKIYAGGDFDTIGGVANTVKIAYYDPYETTPVWHAMATGLAADVNGIAIGKNGAVYAATGAYVKVWEGQAWRTLVTVAGGGAAVNTVAVTAQGMVYFAGTFTSANGIAIANNVGMWNGTSVQGLPITLPGSPVVYALLAASAPVATIGAGQVPDEVYFGFSTEGNATVSGLVSTTALVASNATAPSYPIITIACTVAACTLQEVRNESTGSVIRFNRAMQIGETITIDCRPGVEQVRSDFPPPNGSQVTMLMPSDLGNFALKPGNNRVSVYAPGTGATVTVSLRWRVKHDGVEGGAT